MFYERCMQTKNYKRMYFLSIITIKVLKRLGSVKYKNGKKQQNNSHLFYFVHTTTIHVSQDLSQVTSLSSTSLKYCKISNTSTDLFC